MTIEYDKKWDSREQESELKDLLVVAFSADGMRLACGSSDCLRIVSAATGDVQTRMWYYSKVTAIAWIKEEPSELVCSYEDGTIVNICFGRQSGKIEITYLHVAGHHISHIAASSSDRLLATGAANAVRLWYSSERTSGNYEWHECQPKSLYWSQEADGNEIVIAGMHWLRSDKLIVSYKQHGVMTYDVKTGCMINRIVNTGTRIDTTCLSDDGERLIVAKRTVYELYDVESRNQLRRYPHRAPVGLSIFIHSGFAFVGSFEVGRAKAWFAHSQQKVCTLPHSKLNEEIISIAYHDGWELSRWRIATASINRVVLWEACEEEASEPQSPGRVGENAVRACILIASLIAVYCAMKYNASLQP